MESVIGLDERITQVKVPLPFPLRWVNAYLIRGDSGFTVIDPGLHTGESEQVWDRALKLAGCRYTDVEQIVLTHHHPDHYGMAGWLQERSGAPVLMSEAGKEQADKLWGAGQPMTERIAGLFRDHGMDDGTLEQIVRHLDGFVPLVEPLPEVKFIRAGDAIALGDRRYCMIHTPGHAYGHLCFYDEERRRMFCGDHVLPQISPNVSFLPGGDPNPLRSFLSSLSEVGKLEVRLAYPGHRDPFPSFNERAAELIRHHEDRLRVMRDKLEKPTTAYELCLDVFGRRLTIHQLRFALSETIAHLIYMEETGTIQRSDREGRWHFAAV